MNGEAPSVWSPGVVLTAAAGFVALVVTMLGGPMILLGVAAGIAAVVALAAGMARSAVLALAVPLMVIPVGLLEVPGLGGTLQVIHLATTAAVLGVLVAVLRGRVSAHPPVAITLGLLLVAAMLASAVVSDWSLEALSVSVNHLLGAGLAISAAVVVRGQRTALTWLLRAWTVAAGVLILPALPAAAAATDRFGGSLVDGRVQGVFNQPNEFGEFSMLATIVAGALLAGAANRLDRALGLIGVILGMAGIAVSFSRGTWLGVVAALAVAGLLSARLRGWVIGLAAATSAVALGGAIAGIAPFPALLERFAGLLDTSANPADDRDIVYQHALTVFSEHPILGAGPGSFLQTTYEPGSELIRRTYIHGHSVVLHTAAEVGLVGVAALLLLTVALAWLYVQGRARLIGAGLERTNARLAVLAAGLVGVAVHGIIDVVYTNPLLIPLAWLLAGMLAGASARAVDRLPEPGKQQVATPRPVEPHDAMVGAL